MNLLLTLTSYPPAIGGAQIHTHYLAQELAATNSIQVVTHWDENRTDWLLGTSLRAPNTPKDYLVDNIPVHRIGLANFDKLAILPNILAYYPFMSWALPHIADRIEKFILPFARKSEVIHNVRIGREPISLASLRIAHKLNKPFVFTPLHHPRWAGWRYRQYHSIYRQADAVIALTQSEKQTLVELGVHPGKIHITGVGPVLAPQADGERFRAQWNLANFPIILFLGQKFEYKGLNALLQAAPYVWKMFPDAHFVFLGPRTDFSKRLFSSIIDKRIIENGPVDLKTKTDALQACTILCVPSIQESFGGVYLEAWSFAKPVIGGRIASISEVITDGENGFLVDQSPHEISERINYLLQNPSRADQMGLSGNLRVRDQFTWKKIANKTQTIYESLLHEG